MGLYREDGKANGNYYIIIGCIMGIYWDNGKDIEIRAPTGPLGLCGGILETLKGTYRE